MTEEKQGKRVVRITALIFLLAGIAIGVISVNLPHFPATITEVSDASRVRKSGNSNQRKYKVKVNAVFTDSAGAEQTITGMRVTRSSKTSLPEAGETIQVMNLLGYHEYSLLTPFATAGTLIAIGLVLFISSFRTGKKKSASARRKR